MEIFWIHDFLLSVFPQQWSLGSVSFLFEQANLKRRSPQLEVAITLRHPVFRTLGSGRVVVNVVTFPAQSSNRHEGPLLFGDNGQTSLSCQHLGNVSFLFKDWKQLAVL